MATPRLIAISVAALIASGCTQHSGILETHDRFAFPNSDVVQIEGSNVVQEVTETVFFSQPDLRGMFERAREAAIRQAGGNMLIDLKVKTSATPYIILPITKYTVRIEARAVKAEIFEQKLY